jgi:hypothetical protein
MQKNNLTFKLRKKQGVSIEECSRLCLFEPSFECNIMTYSQLYSDCKWSSLPYPRESTSNADNTVYITTRENYSAFIKDPLYNYVQYFQQVTSVFNYNQSEVSSVNECAYACNTQKDIRCRSFNFCKKENDENSYYCLLSGTNVHNNDNHPNNVTTNLCLLYSSKKTRRSRLDYLYIYIYIYPKNEFSFKEKAINDFEANPNAQLDVQAQSELFNSSIDRCAEMCVLEDSYICRSFDFLSDTNTCLLHRENLKDRLFVKLNVNANPVSTHYSSIRKRFFGC